MPTVILENGDEEEHEQVTVDQGLVKGEVDEGPDHVADTEETHVIYPESSVLKIEVGEDETVYHSDTTAKEYTVQ